MSRNFNRQQRKIFLILSGGICMNCSKPLQNSFHADHILPFSKGGKTITQNGQALCVTCNLKKGVSYDN